MAVRVGPPKRPCARRRPSDSCGGLPRGGLPHTRAVRRFSLIPDDAVIVSMVLSGRRGVCRAAGLMSAAVQQRDITLRLTITRLRPGASSMAISPRLSASLMAARVLALPMLARSAMRATGSVHFPVGPASSRMTARTAIASVFKSSATSGGTTTVAARNRRPHITRRTGAVLLVSSAIG
jgi:hypothetical protein